MASNISIKDAVQLRGEFLLRVLDRKGRVIAAHEDRNMIVNLARTALAMLVSEGSPDKIITKVAVGTGAIPATPADTGLTDMYANRIIRHDFPAEGSVRFIWRMGYDEANNMDISEFGLFCEDGSLFSRKVRESIYKADDLAFEGEWTIIF